MAHYYPSGEEATLPPVSLEEVKSCWKELLFVLRQRDHLHLQALLRSGNPVGTEGKVVFICFKHPFHKGKAEEDANRRVLEQFLGQLVGQPVQVRCILPDEWEHFLHKRPQPPGDGPQQHQENIADLQRKADNLRSEIHRQEATLAKVKAEHDGFIVRLDALRLEVAREKRQLGLLQVKREQLKTDLEGNELDLKARHEEVVTEEQRLKKLRWERTKIEEQITELESKQAELVKRQQELEQEVARGQRRDVSIPPIAGLAEILGVPSPTIQTGFRQATN